MAFWLKERPNRSGDTSAVDHSFTGPVLRQLGEGPDGAARYEAADSMGADASRTRLWLPIQYALSFPKRIDNEFKRLDFKEFSKLTFEQPDYKTFRNLALAKDAMYKGGNAPCVLNAANEVVVNAFLQNKVGFLEMSEMIEKTLERVAYIETPTLEDYEASDKEARIIAAELAKQSQLSFY